MYLKICFAISFIFPGNPMFCISRPMFFACIVLIFKNFHGKMNFPWTIVERAFSPPLLPVIARIHQFVIWECSSVPPMVQNSKQVFQTFIV